MSNEEVVFNFIEQALKTAKSACLSLGYTYNEDLKLGNLGSVVTGRTHYPADPNNFSEEDVVALTAFTSEDLNSIVAKGTEFKIYALERDYNKENQKVYLQLLLLFKESA